jgi:SAM-dependent methyltransferase
MALRKSSSEKSFSDRAEAQRSASERAGRLPNSEADEEHIWADILAKLPMRQGENGLDIGCGCGTIALYMIEQAKRLGGSLTMVDFAKPIELLRDMLPVPTPAGITLLGGAFPELTPPTGPFDFILMYSVMHYMDDFDRTMDAAVGLLRPGGRLLVGDIPNLSRKGRFLASDFGRAFDASYKSVPVESLPVYRDHHELVDKLVAGNAPPLTDAWLLRQVGRFRDAGFDAFILPQPPQLPFCFTREDLLIVRPHD